ncbi:M56 family metallopeptidase [Fulvivirgaceae bacterium BMA10]|uniref:M56 family metallopeptidase n=1 Tax=Splendidivirga corallicola TaxID=3051826 RepID=A0ABT8L0W7_9BACT|nr:M56 family metallopeptidase [Fulvivirgaceae bacterium BMA10]
MIFPLIEINQGMLSFGQRAIDFSIEQATGLSLNAVKQFVQFPVSDFGVSLGDIFLVVYIMGLLLRLCMLSFSLYKIFKIIPTSTGGMIGGYQLVKTKRSFVAGSFFKYIFIGELFQKLSQNEKDIILKHERAHLDQKHTLDICLVEIVSTVLWFNPILILIKRSVRNVHEYCADNATAASHSVKNYLQLLLSIAIESKRFSLFNNFSHSQLKKRMVMLSKKRNSTLDMIKVLLILPIVALLLFSFSHLSPRDNGIKFYLDGKLINHKEGIKYSDIQVPGFKGELSYNANGKMMDDMRNHGAKMRIILARETRSIKQFEAQKLESQKTLQMLEVFELARPGDRFVIEFFELPEKQGFPRFILLPVKD